LRDPNSVQDRSVLLPYMDGKSYAIINRDWRYIRYHDGAEELYDLNNDPHEWHNLASEANHAAVKKRLAAQAPSIFAAPATDFKKLRLVTEGEDYRWELKPEK
ncbi:MAG: sulfatase/phosphatase domain-containing protein, partial [Planctomycetota bacterium]